MKNPWKKLILNKPYILPEDKDILDTFNSKAKEEVEIKYNVLPEPFIGNINAPIVLLILNPGFEDNDPKVHSKTKFQNLIVNNLNHNKTEYPFYFLNPEISESEGSKWWNKKLSRLIEQIDPKKLSNNLLAIEYFPYHSRKYKHNKNKLHSQEYSFFLVREAIKRNAQIIIMRSKKIWLKAVPELESYEYHTLNSPQNVIISPKNLGEKKFEKIINILNER